MEEEQSAWPSLSTAMAHQTLDEGNAFSPHRETTGGGVGLHPHSKASAFRREKQVNPLVRKISWRRKPHPSILAWRIPWTEEAGGLQSMGSQSRTQPTKHHQAGYKMKGVGDGQDGGCRGWCRAGAEPHIGHAFWLFVVVEVTFVLRATVRLQGRPEPVRDE